MRNKLTKKRALSVRPCNSTQLSFLLNFSILLKLGSKNISPANINELSEVYVMIFYSRHITTEMFTRVASGLSCDACVA